MANQSASRLLGDRYQHLYSWHKVLDLLYPVLDVTKVRVEDEDALSMDDVTMHHGDGRARYYQVKFHVDHRDGYSQASLTKAEQAKRSLAQKWFRSYQRLMKAGGSYPPELFLVSNWTWHKDDVLPQFICGIHGSVKESLWEAGPASHGGKLRLELCAHLTVDDAGLAEFLRRLRFKVAFGDLADVERSVAERMQNLGLRHDAAALHTADGIVREWISRGPQELSRELVFKKIGECGLWLPAEEPRALHVHLLTIKEQRFDIEPDYRLDWREHFIGPENQKGHEVVAPETWNARLMPELIALEQRVNTETATRFIRVRGKSRLSAWTAFGFVFSGVNGYVLEVEQNGMRWLSSAAPSSGFDLASNGPDGERCSGEGDTVAVGISVSGSLDEQVRRDVQRRGNVRALLLLRPERELGAGCLRDASDATGLAGACKRLMRDFAARHHARRMLLYYFGPLAGASFIGHQLNAVCPQVQLMEHLGASGFDYSPSFLLGDSTGS